MMNFYDTMHSMILWISLLGMRTDPKPATEHGYPPTALAYGSVPHQQVRENPMSCVPPWLSPGSLEICSASALQPCSTLLHPHLISGTPSSAHALAGTPLGDIQVTDKGKKEQQDAELRLTLLLPSSKCQASLFQHHHVLHSLLS